MAKFSQGPQPGWTTAKTVKEIDVGEPLPSE